MTSQTINNLLVEFESLTEIEKGQMSDQITIELSIIEDFCEAAKEIIHRETQKIQNVPENLRRTISGNNQLDENPQEL